jgi:DNA-directed RNA polymerase I subunit RPA43
MESQSRHETRCVISACHDILLAHICLVGRVNLCSPDHISLLIHRTFNASIPRHHIPTADWVFQYGPAENDPEFGPEAQGYEEGEEQESSGKWISRHTGENIGGEHGNLKFTVIG